MKGDSPLDVVDVDDFVQADYLNLVRIIDVESVRAVLELLFVVEDVDGPFAYPGRQYLGVVLGVSLFDLSLIHI